jgi:hypothetical protein
MNWALEVALIYSSANGFLFLLPKGVYWSLNLG